MKPARENRERLVAVAVADAAGTAVGAEDMVVAAKVASEEATKLQ